VIEFSEVSYFNHRWRKMAEKEGKKDDQEKEEN
jgi:hypothetical protein